MHVIFFKADFLEALGYLAEAHGHQGQAFQSAPHPFGRQLL
jgi:hypothetical protein